MPFFPGSAAFQKNNARNIMYMAVLIFLKYLDLRKMPLLGYPPGRRMHYCRRGKAIFFSRTFLL